MVAVVQEVKVDPFETVRSPIRRLFWSAMLSIVLSLVLVAGVVAVVVYTGVQSIQAFEELPRYRVNVLTNDYNDAVKRFEQSLQETGGVIAGEPANRVLEHARFLSETVLQSEKDFSAIVAIYGETMSATAEQIGGALEWQRYFRAQIDQLRQQSENRQQALTAIVAQFPRPPAAAASPSQPNAAASAATKR